MIRIIAPIFVDKGLAYQTLGFNSGFRPLGAIDNILRVYNKQEVDEIFIAAKNDDKKALDEMLLASISRLNIQTPLIYSGGIKSVDDIKRCLDSGVDRIAVNSILYTPKELDKLITYIGVQGIVAVCPFKKNDNEYMFYNTSTGLFGNKINHISYLMSLDLEFFLIDANADGTTQNFDLNVLDLFGDKSLIIQGGRISFDKISNRNINAVSIENRLLWSEVKYFKIKSSANHLMQRKVKL